MIDRLCLLHWSCARRPTDCMSSYSSSNSLPAIFCLVGILNDGRRFSKNFFQYGEPTIESGVPDENIALARSSCKVFSSSSVMKSINPVIGFCVKLLFVLESLCGLKVEGLCSLTSSLSWLSSASVLSVATLCTVSEIMIYVTVTSLTQIRITSICLPTWTSTCYGFIITLLLTSFQLFVFLWQFWLCRMMKFFYLEWTCFALNQMFVHTSNIQFSLVSVPVGRLWKQWLVCYSIVQRWGLYHVLAQCASPVCVCVKCVYVLVPGVSR